MKHVHYLSLISVCALVAVWSVMHPSPEPKARNMRGTAIANSNSAQDYATKRLPSSVVPLPTRHSRPVPALSGGPPPPLDDYVPEAIVEEFTEEELEHERYRDRRTNPYYWDLAPSMFESILEEQAPDSVWTQQIREPLTKVLGGVEFRETQLQDVQCYASLCKVIVTHSGPQAYETFRREGTVDGPLDTNAYGVKTDLDDGRVQTTIYLSRPTDASPFDEARERMLTLLDGDARTESGTDPSVAMTQL